MGYWSYLITDTCGTNEATVEEFNNQTHNTHALIYKAMGKCFYDFDRWVAGDMIMRLRLGICRIEADPESFRKYEPANKWGTVESSLKYMKEALAACLKYPFAKYSYSG